MNVFRNTVQRSSRIEEGDTPYSPTTVDPEALVRLRRLTGDATSTFRDDQWEVIDAVVNRREQVLLVQRTGWGKSAVYFISARMLRDRGRGLTLIVSPLLGLMRNQVFAGKRMGLRIGALHSGTNDRFDIFREMIAKDTVDVLLVSPERFANDAFRERLLPLIADRLALLVIDEAHCISDWGHDFRPDYQRLRNVVENLPPNSPLLATTATANNRVVADVSNQLGRLRVSRGPLVRENLALQTLPTMTATERLAWLARIVPELPGKGIVYTLTKRDAEAVASWLVIHGVSAHAYHGDIATAEFPVSYDARIDLEDRFTNGDLSVLVATSALGMGYDNPDIRFVIHYQTPGSIIAYYQQVGRAGRGRDPAVGVLMSGPEDGEIHETFRTQALPSGDEIASILAALNKSDSLTTTQISGAVNMSRGRLDHALNYLSVLQPAPIARQEKAWRRNPVSFDPAYAQHRRALISAKEIEWKEITAYRRAEDTCQISMHLRALDDPAPIARCGRCANCLGRLIFDVVPDASMTRAAAEYLNRPAVTPIAPRRQFPKGAISIYPKSRIPQEHLAEAGCVLTSWHDDEGIGHLVKTGKHSGKFDDRVLAASVDMITRLWKPEPVPAWITFVPSWRHPELVPDFARRLADRLGLTCVPCVIKTRETEPQKLQENSFHQSRNLVGVFEVSNDVRSGPLILVDDMVDSGWTFTMIAALLRQAGSGPVFPFALISTRKSDG